MIRLVLIVFVLMNVAGRAWADDLAMAATMVATVHSISGAELKNVSKADQGKGTKSEIIVKDNTGKITHILLTSNTTIWDADAKAVTPDKIPARGRVNVIFLSTDEGINVGQTVIILK